MKKLWGVVALLVLLFGRFIAAQERSLEAPELFRAAVNEALRDREISEEEAKILEVIRQGLNISPEQAAAIKAEVVKSLPKTFDQSGRYELVLHNIALGMGLYGWGIPYALDIDDSKWYIGGEMLSLGATYYLTYQFTKKMDIPHAKVQMIRIGTLLGLNYANTVSQLIEYDDFRLKTTLMMLGVPIGIVAADRLYHHWQPSLGQGWSLMQWSEVTGSVCQSIYRVVRQEPEYNPNVPWDQYEEYEKKYERRHQRWETGNAVAFSLGLPVGLYLGHRLYGARQYTLGDGILISTGRFTGSIYSVLCWDLLFRESHSDDSPAAYLFRSAFNIGGIVLADKLIAGKDYTTGQALLTTIGGVSGGLFGVGIGVITEVKNSRVINLLAIGGSLAGFYLANRVINVRDETADTQLSQRLSLMPYYSQYRGHRSLGLGLSYSF